MNAWLKILDNHKIGLETHGQKVGFLRQEYNLSAILSEKIALEYEKEIHEKISKECEISKSKMFQCEISKLYSFMKNIFKSPSFEFFPTEIIVDNKDKNIQVKCDDNSYIIAYFYSTRDKTQLVIQHAKLKNSKMYEDIKKFWMRKLKEIEKEIID